MVAPAPDVDEVVRLGFEVDPVLTLGELGKGPRDPTIRFERGVVWRALRTKEGPATTRLAPAVEGWRGSAGGPGARAAVAAKLCGLTARRGCQIAARTSARGAPRGGARLALIDTLRAAVPWQGVRRREAGSSESGMAMV